MEQIKELEEVLELLNTKQYTKLRQYLLNSTMPILQDFWKNWKKRICSKSSAFFQGPGGRRFSYLDMDNQRRSSPPCQIKEATNIINNLMANDAADLLEEMPANIVKKLLTNASPEVRRNINHLLRYPEDSAGKAS